MKLNELILLKEAIEKMELVLDASSEEIIECLEKRLISKEEAGELRRIFQ